MNKVYIAPIIEIVLYETAECLSGSSDKDYNDTAEFNEIGNIFQ